MRTIGTVGAIKALKTKDQKPFYSIRMAEKNGEGQYEETTWWDVTFFPGKVKENKADIEFSSINVGDLISVSGVAHAEHYKTESGEDKAGLKLKSTWIEVVARKGASADKKDVKASKKSKDVQDDDIPF